MLFKSKAIVLAAIIILFATALPVFAKGKLIESPSIIINLPSRTIELYSGSSLIKEYPVAIGKPSTPTPLGNFSVLSKEVNPHWYPPDEPGKIVPPGPYNPLGYRWMGFISNIYGIHGTNDPRSIGRIVSNGCVRMFEPDVEELFDMVSHGTPVRIVYNRVKFFTDDSGKVKLKIYPDVYGYGKLTVSSIRKQLSKYSLNGFVSDDYLKNLIVSSTAQPEVLVETVKLKINGNILHERGVIAGGTVYIPVNPVANSLNKTLSFDAERSMLNLSESGSKIPVLVSDNTLYVTAENLEALFGGHTSWQEGFTFFSFDKITVYFNQNITSLDVRKINNMAAVPVKDLARVLNRTGWWDETLQIFHLENSENPLEQPTKLVLGRDVDIIGSEPFIKITKINEHFNTFVYWNVADNSIELIYPIP